MPQSIKKSDEEKERDRKWRSLSLEDHPETLRNAADTADLHRFEVKGVVYAFDKKDAEKRCSEWNLGVHLSAAVVEDKE